MSSNFNCSYMTMSSLTYSRGFSVKFFFQPIYTDYANNGQLKFHPPFFLFLVWRPSWLEVGITGHIFERGPSKDHSTKVWFKLAQWLQRSWLKCENLTDDGRTCQFHILKLATSLLSYERVMVPCELSTLQKIHILKLGWYNYSSAIITETRCLTSGDNSSHDPLGQVS
jgi:hypothetical protein